MSLQTDPSEITSRLAPDYVNRLPYRLLADVNRCNRVANKRFLKTSGEKIVHRTREHVSSAWKAIQRRGEREGGRGEKDGAEGGLSTTCYLHTLQALRGTITIARATIRMQMSQRALIWICVSAISLNNNRQITITRDLRDSTGRGTPTEASANLRRRINLVNLEFRTVD